MQHFTPGSGPRLQPPSTGWSRWPILRPQTPQLQGHRTVSWPIRHVYPNAQQSPGFVPRIHLPNQLGLRNPGYNFRWGPYPQVTPLHLSHRQPSPLVGMGRDGGEDRWRGNQEERVVHRVPSAVLARDVVREKYEREPSTSVSSVKKEADFKRAMMSKDKGLRTFHNDSSQHREKSIERNQEKDIKPSMKTVEGESKVKDSSKSRDSPSPHSSQNCVVKCKSTSSDPSASSSQGDNSDERPCQFENSRTSVQLTSRDTASLNSTTASATASESKCKSCLYQTVRNKNPVVVLERLPESDLRKYMRRSISPAESCPESGSSDDIPAISERPHSAPSSSFPSSEVKASDFESLKDELSSVSKSVSEKLGAHGAFEIDPRVKNLSRPLQRACSSGKDASELTFNVPKIHLSRWSSQSTSKNIFFVKHNDLDKLRTKLSLAKMGVRKPIAKSLSHPSKKKSSKVENSQEVRAKVDTAEGSSSAPRLSYGNLQKKKTIGMDSFQRYLDENQETLTSSDSSDQEEDVKGGPGQSERLFRSEHTPSASDRYSQEEEHKTHGKTVTEKTSGGSEKRNPVSGGPNIDSDKNDSCPPPSVAGDSSSDEFESVHSSCSPTLDVQSKALPSPSSSVQSRDVSPLAGRFSPVQTLTSEGAPFDSIPRSSTESMDSGVSMFGNNLPDATNCESAQPESLDLDAGKSAEDTVSAGQVEVPTESVEEKQVTVWKDKLLAAEFSPSSQPISVSDSEGYQIDTDNLEVASFEEVCMKVVSPCEDISMSVEGDVSGSWLDKAISESKWNYGETEAMSSLPSEVDSGHVEGWSGGEEKEKTMPVLTKETLDWRKESSIAVGNSGGETSLNLHQDVSLAEGPERFSMNHGSVSHPTIQLEDNKAGGATSEDTGALAPANLKNAAVTGDAVSDNQESHPEAPTHSHEASPDSKSDELKDVEVPGVSVTAETPEISNENFSVDRQVLDQLSDCLLEFTQDVMPPSSIVSSVKSAQVVDSSLSDCEDNSNHLVIDEGTECSEERWETPSESSPNQKTISVGNDRPGPSHEHIDQEKAPADEVCKTVADAPKPDLLPNAHCLETQHQPNESRGPSSTGIVEEKDQSTAVSKLSSPDGPEKVSSMQSLQKTCNEDVVNSPSAPPPIAHAGASEERPNKKKSTDHQEPMQTVQPAHEIATALPSSFQTTPSDCTKSTPLVDLEMTSALISTGIQQQAPLLPVNTTSIACVPPVMSQTPLMQQQQTTHGGVLNFSVMQAPQSQGPPQLITSANCPIVLQVGNFLAPVCSGVLLTSSIPAQTVSAGMTEVTLVHSLTSQAGNSTSGIDSPANGLMHSGMALHSKSGSNPGSFMPRVSAPVSFPVQLIPVVAPTLPSMPAWEVRKERPILPASARTGSSSAPASACGATGCSGEDEAKLGVGKRSDRPEPSPGEDSELGLVITSVRGGVDAEAAVLEVDAMPQCSLEGGPSTGSYGGTSVGSNMAQSTAPGPSVGLHVASSTLATQSSSAPIMTTETATCQPWARSKCSNIGPPPPLVRLSETSLSSGQPSTSGSSSVPHGRETGTDASDATRHLVQAPTSMAYECPENMASVPNSSLGEKDKRNSSGLQQRAEIMSPPGTYNYVLPEYLQEQVASIVNMSPSHCTLQNNLGGLGSPHLLTEPPPLDGLLNADQEPCEEQDMSVGATLTVETQDFSAFNLSPTNKTSVWAAATVEPRDHLRLPVRIAPNAASAASEKTAQTQQLQTTSNKGKMTTVEKDHVAVAHRGEGLEQDAKIQDSAVDSHQKDITEKDQQTAGASWTMSESSPNFPSTEQASSGDNVEFPIEVDIAATTPGGEMNSSDSYETDSTMTYSCDEDALVKQSSSPPVIRCYRKSDVPPQADDSNQSSVAPKSAQQKEGLTSEGSEDTSSGKKPAVKRKSRKSAARKQGRRLKRKNDDPSAKVQFRILKQCAEGAAETASEGIVLRKLNRRSCRENKVVVTNAMMVQSENGMLGTVFSSDEEITDPESPPYRSPPSEEPREFTQESVMRELGLTKCSDAGSTKVKGSGSHSSDSPGRKIRASTRSQRRQWASKGPERGSREKKKSPTDGASEDTASPPLEDLDSEELPRIHPPKRRRCSQGKSGNGGLTRSGALNMQDAVPGPAQGGSGSSERIMREFPRHNWLEQKIQQLSSGPHVAAQAESASPASATRRIPARDMAGSLDEPSPPPPPGKKSIGSGERHSQKANVVFGKMQPEGNQQIPGELESNDYKNKLRRRYPPPEQSTNAPFAECAISNLEREEKEKMASSVACDSDKSMREEQSSVKPSPIKDGMNVDEKTWPVANMAKKVSAMMSPPEDGKSCVSEAPGPDDAQLQQKQVSDMAVEMETDHETCARETVTGDWETPVNSKSTSQPSSTGTVEKQPGSADHDRDVRSPESAPTAESLTRHATGIEGGSGVGDTDIGNPKAASVEAASGSMKVPGASNPSSALMVGSEESKEARRKDLLSTQAKAAREGKPGATDKGPEPRSELDASSQDAAPLDLCTKKQHSVLPSPRTRAHPPPVQLVHPQVQQPVPAAPPAPSPDTLILQTKLALSNVQVVPETPGPPPADSLQTPRTEEAESVPLSLTVRGTDERKDEASSAGRSRSLTGVGGLSGRPADSEPREAPVLDAAVTGAVLAERPESIPHPVSQPTPIGSDWQNQATMGAHMQHSVDAAAASNPSAVETTDASAEDLDPEYERELRELRELEELAARKEKEREEVLSMRKRKAETIRSMEEQRKRLKLSAVSGGTSQQTTSATPQAMNASVASSTSTSAASVSGPEVLKESLPCADARLSSLATTASWTTSSGSVTPAAQTTSTVASGGSALAASSQLPLGVPSMRLPVSIAVHPSHNVPASKSGSVTAGTTSVSTSVGVPSITVRSHEESTSLVPSSIAGQGPQPSASDNQPSNVPTLPTPLSTIVSWISSAAVASATPALSSTASSRFDAKVTTATSCRSSATVSGGDGTKSSVAQGGISQLPNTQGEIVGAFAVGLSGTKAAATAADNWRPMVHMINKAMHEKARQSEQCAMEEMASETNKDMPHRSRNNSTSGSAEMKTSDADRIGPPATAHQHQSSVNTKVHLEPVPPFIKNSCPYLARSNPLEEPPAPLSHKSSPNPGSLQPAHSQRPFQLAGYLIMPASSASSTSALTPGTSISTVSSDSASSQLKTSTSSHQDSPDGKVPVSSAIAQLAAPPALFEQARKAPPARGLKRPALPVQSTPVLPSRVPGTGGPPQLASIVPRSAQPHYGQSTADPRAWAADKTAMQYQRAPLPETIDLTVESSEMHATGGWSAARGLGFVPPRTADREAYVQTAMAKRYSTEDPHHHSLRLKADSLGHPDRSRAAPPHVIVSSKESAFQPVVPATTVPVRLVQDNTIVMVAPGKKSHPERSSFEVAGLPEIYQNRSGEMVPVIPGGSGSSGLSHHSSGQYPMQHHAMMNPMMQSSHVRDEAKQLQQQQQQHGSSSGYPSHALYHQSRQVAMQYPSGRQQLGAYPSDQDRRYTTAQASAEIHPPQQTDLTPQGHQQYYAGSRGPQPMSHHMVGLESMGHSSWPQGYPPHAAPSASMVPQASGVSHAGASPAQEHASSLSHSQRDVLMQRQIQQQQQLYQQQYLQQQQQQQQRRRSPLYPSRAGPAQMSSSSSHQGSLASRAQPYPGLHSRPHASQQLPSTQHEVALLSRMQPLHPSVQGYPQPPPAAAKPDVPSLIPHNKQVAGARPTAAPVPPKASGLQPVNGSCAVCGNLAIYLCSNCRKIWYCSGGCQTAHWRVHAADCKELV